jgi:phasin family protein
MSNAQNFQSIVDATQDAMAPVARYNEFATKAIERIARKQWEVASACVELGLEQMSTFGKTQDVQTAVSAQQELTSRWTDTLTRGSMEMMEIVRENQAEAVDIFTAHAKEAGEKATKAAAKTAKKAA